MSLSPYLCFTRSKLINPRDANPVGAMHGGNVLSLLEEAGIIAATRHINTHRDTTLPPCVAALARMEKVTALAVFFFRNWDFVFRMIMINIHFPLRPGRFSSAYPRRRRGRGGF